MDHLTNYERETIINFNEGEDTASVYTHNRALRRRLEKLAEERPGDCRLFKVSHGDQAVEYYIPKAWVRINPSRILSDEQKAAMAENARARFLGRNSKAITGEQATDAAQPGKAMSQPPDNGETKEADHDKG